MGEFKLDTSGCVWTPHGQLANTYWEDLSPFQQGYIEAAIASLKGRSCGWCGRDAQEAAGLRSCRRHRQCTSAVRAERARLWKPPGYSDLANSTLAQMIADCEAFLASVKGAYPLTASHGAVLWAKRQRGEAGGFPPLTLTLGDDGKIYAREAGQ